MTVSDLAKTFKISEATIYKKVRVGVFNQILVVPFVGIRKRTIRFNPLKVRAILGSNDIDLWDNKDVAKYMKVPPTYVNAMARRGRLQGCIVELFKSEKNTVRRFIPSKIKERFRR